jgi:hypothetical protein
MAGQPLPIVKIFAFDESATLCVHYLSSWVDVGGRVMQRNIHRAAIELQEWINAPLEAVNIAVFADDAGRHIRVFAAPEQESWVAQIPPTFAGFRVVVEYSQFAPPMSAQPSLMGSQHV